MQPRITNAQTVHGVIIAYETERQRKLCGRRRLSPAGDGRVAYTAVHV
jgi:hypothetical protein